MALEPKLATSGDVKLIPAGISYDGARPKNVTRRYWPDNTASPPPIEPIHGSIGIITAGCDTKYDNVSHY